MDVFEIWSFLTIIILVFAIVMVIAGLFSAYFGAGKSRAYGGILFFVGLIVGVVWVYLVSFSGAEPFCGVPVWEVLYSVIIDLLAVLIGALIAVGIFLVVVLKS